MDQNVLQKLKVLPQYQKKEVLDFLDFLVKKTETVVKPAKKYSRQKKKFKFDWEGGLADMQKRLYLCRITTQGSGVAMKYLIDTNIFPEILLKQDKATHAKAFLTHTLTIWHL